MSQEFNFGESDKIRNRERELVEFIDRMFDQEDRPYFVSDEACLYDVYAGDDLELSERCERWYGKKLTQSEFRLPVWRLLDMLYG
jgi:hypothetical protein